jgi:4-diphosphocytidyl-2-C-methyl-D-erythritol kinase
VRPGRALATGAGERVRRLAPGAPFGVLVLPHADALSTAAVFSEADRLGLARDADGLAERAAAVDDALARDGELTEDLLVNDLEPAALSLVPSIATALDEARAAGAAHAVVSGSGPTVVGLFPGAGGPARARAAAGALAARVPAPMSAQPLG